MEGPQGRDFAWFVTERWQEFRGELRSNLLRLAAIAGFYTIHLFHRGGFSLGPLRLEQNSGLPVYFHDGVTLVCAAWVVTAVCVLLLLRARLFGSMLKFGSTAADLFYLTTLLMLADGPRSPLVVCYLLLIVLAGLRFSLPLVRFVTAGATVSYLVLALHTASLRPALAVPRYHQAIFLLAVVVTGVLLGQVIRRAREAAEDYAEWAA